MKELITLMLALITALSCFACSFNPSNWTNPELGDGDDAQTGKEFTVTLSLDGAKFTQTQNVVAVWRKIRSQEVVESVFGADGVARTTGLDGNYKVTLRNLPEEYSYNPNAEENIVTSRVSSTTIKVYKLNEYTGDGTGLYAPNIIEASNEGAYRITLDSKKYKEKGKEYGVKYFQFRPLISGKYRIESWVDTTFNEINPFVDVYFGSFAYKAFEKTQDDGGEQDTYTKNFLFQRQVYDDEIGNVFAFGVHCTQKNDTFPVTIDFYIYRYDEHNRNGNGREDVVPQHDFSTPVVQESGTWTWAEGNDALLDADDYQLNSNDGFYYLVDENGNRTNKKLYAMLTKSVAFKKGKRPFEDYRGSMVSFSLFSSGALPSNPLQNINGLCYNDFMAEYARHCNGDGVYPVTEELKLLFQQFAINQRYFADGQGWYETSFGIMSVEDNQWLFPCGYYA